MNRESQEVNRKWSFRTKAKNKWGEVEQTKDEAIQTSGTWGSLLVPEATIRCQ